MNSMHNTRKHSLKRNQSALTIAAGLLALGASSAMAQDSNSSAILHTQQIPAGTEVKLMLRQGINSGTAHIGDTVRATTAPDDRSGLPVGTAFIGHVTEVKPATAKYAGVLTVSFGIPRERGYNGASNDNDPNSTRNGDNETYRDSDNGRPSMAFSDAASVHLTGQGAHADKSNYTTIGAGAGALLGFVRKRKLGDAIGGAVLGGAGGYAVNAAQKRAGGDVSLQKGAETTVHLDTPLVLRTEIVAPY